ncbi:PLP-dependent aminotransferase family protein [Actinophytocola sp.]|uniref:aminotransferase-like domain-containing protein n=1 Tax=Actinophytocola sp. TaxID=1872138 RepID=UPI002ED2905E
MESARTFTSALGDWREDHKSLTTSLADAVREAVLDGRISVGSPLPAERTLAAALGVSRGTVVAGLAELRDDGWLRTRHGSRSVVRLPPRLTERTAPWSVDRGQVAGATRIDLTAAVTAAPHGAYLAALERATGRCATLLVDSGTSTAGLPSLREAVADRYTRAGLPTRPDQILITSGAMAALHLLVDQLHDRRRPVLVEQPTFPGALAVLRGRRARMITSPVTADGWDLDRFAETVRTDRPGLAYVMPDFHNPTGAMMSAAARSRLAALDLPVVADETMRDLDLRLSPSPERHLTGPNVINIGSTSKVFWSGLRVGWIRASAARIRELLLNPLQPPLSPPPLEQLIADELLRDISSVLAERTAQLRAQRDHLVALLAGGDWTYTTPPGGLAVWLRLHHTTAAASTRRATRAGLMLSPGPTFAADRTLTHYLRIPFTATTDVLDHAGRILRESAGAPEAMR